jgi:opacity protein-like surface antigen
MRRFAVPMLLGTLAMTAVSTRAEAQVNVFIGGGPSLPMGDFKDYAKTGWLLQGGLGVDISKGLFLEAEGFFGSNAHEATGTSNDKTNIMAFMAALGKSFGTEDAKVSPYVLAGVGMLGHQFRSDDDLASEGTETKFGYTGAVGLSFRLNEKARFWLEARYLGAEGTAVLPLFVGISIGLGGGGS